jgi:hypothetical protein
MTQIPKTIYALIIFLFLFLVVIDGGKDFFTPFQIYFFILCTIYHHLFSKHLFIVFDISGFIPCNDWRDCPKHFCVYPRRKECVGGFCECE